MWNWQWIEVFSCPRDMDMWSLKQELMLKRHCCTWMEDRLMVMLLVHILHFLNVQNCLRPRRLLQYHLL